MSSKSSNFYETDPECIRLMKFLIERTKDAKSTLSINALAKEFKRKRGSSQNIPCLYNRIRKLGERVADLNTIETDTKVKMMFALSVSADENFLNELRKDADVTVDEKNRITKYTAKDGSLELEEQSQLQNMGTSYTDMWKNDPGCIELMKFLIERTKDAKSPLNIKQLAREFKEKSGSSQTISCLVNRIRKLGERVADLDTIDKATKVKLMFALSASIDEDFLNEIRKNADVEVDGKNRITKYRANDGSLELEGDQSHSAKMRDVLKPKTDGEEDFGGVSQDSMPKTPGSVKRSAVEVPNSSKRTKVKSEDSAPDDSVRIPSRKPTPPNPETQLLRQPKLEGDPGAEEASITRSEGAPRASGPAPEAARAHIPQGAPVRPKSEPNQARGAPIHSNSEVNDAYTPQTKFLEAIQSLILTLYMKSPCLSLIQSTITKKLLESPNKTISNDEMTLAMELMVTRITNQSISDLPENMESVSLCNFLCYLKTVILSFKLGGLENLLEKINGKIRESAGKEKNIPVEKVASVLQDTLNNVGI